MQNSTIVLLLEGLIKICSKVQCKNIDFHKTYFFKKTTVDRVCVHVGDSLLFFAGRGYLRPMALDPPPPPFRLRRRFWPLPASSSSSVAASAVLIVLLFLAGATQARMEKGRLGKERKKIFRKIPALSYNPLGSENETPSVESCDGEKGKNWGQNGLGGLGREDRKDCSSFSLTDNRRRRRPLPSTSREESYAGWRW